jgi:hypothetical protein
MPSRKSFVIFVASFSVILGSSSGSSVVPARAVTFLIATPESPKPLPPDARGCRVEQ